MINNCVFNEWQYCQEWMNVCNYCKRILFARQKIISGNRHSCRIWAGCTKIRRSIDKVLAQKDSITHGMGKERNSVARLLFFLSMGLNPWNLVFYNVACRSLDILNYMIGQRIFFIVCTKYSIFHEIFATVNKPTEKQSIKTVSQFK